MGKVVNGWVINLDTGRYGTHYLNRAAATYFFVGANLPEDAVYPNTTKDSDGNAFDAANKYTLRFDKGETPPANNFWSLTMYDQGGYLVPNAINRQSISDRSKTMPGADGSLTIYIQAESPADGHVDNWLPTPTTGPFKLYLRLYQTDATRSRRQMGTAACVACQIVLNPKGAKMPGATERSESTATSRDLVTQGVHRRAIEVVIWGMPAVNFDLLYQSMVRANGAWNQVVYWSRLPDWKNQTLTPNPDVLYFMPLINTKEVGPVVLEIPPAGGDGSITGSMDDGWQTAIEDVGPAGVDKGKGGKYLILPPGNEDKAPEGYIPMPSSTYQSYGLLRSNPKSGNDADVAKAVDYGKQVKVYPLSSAATPPATVFVDVIDIVYDNIIPYDLRFFQSLDRMIQFEPWLDRDRAMIDLLKSVGIEKGKPFNPDASRTAILNAAAADAHNYLDARLRGGLPAAVRCQRTLGAARVERARRGLQTNFANPDSYPTDARGLAYSYVVLQRQTPR